MVKLEEDHTYIELQRQLKAVRDQELALSEHKAKIMYHINAIKRNYYQYELEEKVNV